MKTTYVTIFGLILLLVGAAVYLVVFDIPAGRRFEAQCKTKGGEVIKTRTKTYCVKELK